MWTTLLWISMVSACSRSRWSASPTSSSALATSLVGTPSPQPRALNLSRGMAPLSLSAELSGVIPVDVVIEPAATSAESETVTLSAALALPSTAEYLTSVRWVPPESSCSADSAQTSGSIVPPTSGSASSGPTPSSAVVCWLALPRRSPRRPRFECLLLRRRLPPC
ncbi:hypothetical protein PF001_g26354 [Phytophthora fragariae]|uniref:Secreted protein n=1 Tax=Phytophthora fragariae TaxID=53985 RepID=A0A6A4BTN1_9STRA|nr:hypothetical protein PF001_g26354 [Phytophthora fragariae]